MDRPRFASPAGGPKVRLWYWPALAALIVIAIVVGATGSAVAFWDSTIGTSGRATVNAGSFGTNGDHQVAVDGSYVHVVWVQGTNVNYRRSSDGGRTWSTSAGWTAPTAASGSIPAVAAANGRVIVAYGRSTSNGTLRIKTSNDNGTTWTADTARVTGGGTLGTGTIDGTFADAVMVSTGASTTQGLLVYRFSNGGVTGAIGAYAMPFTVSGTTWTYGAGINVASGAAAGTPRVAASNTNAYLMWVPTSGSATMYRSTSVDWSTWGAAAAPPALTGVQSLAAEDGNAYEAYTTAAGTHVAKYSSSSNSWSTGVLAVEGASPTEAAISANGTRIHVVAAYSSGSGKAPQSRMSTDGGATWRPQKTVPTPSGSTYYVNLAAGAALDGLLYTDTSSLYFSGWAVDLTPPSVPTLSAMTLGTSSILLTWSASTDVSPSSDNVYYSVYTSGGSLIATTAATSFTVTDLDPETDNGFYATASDDDGNTSSSSAMVWATTDALRTDPTIAPGAADGQAGWYSSEPTVSLASNSAGTTYYSWDDTASPVAYSGAFTAIQGSHTLFYRSVDTSGHAESWNSLQFKVDTVAPTAATLTSSAVGTSTVDLSWSGSTDDGSGIVGYRVYNADTSSQVASTTATTASLTGLDPGTTYHFVVRTVDEAGNVSADSNTLTVTTEALDTTAPTTTRSVVPGSPDGANEWYVTAPVVTLSANEPGTTYYAIDGGAASAYGSPVTIAEGTHTITYRSVDLASNSETTRSATFKVDTSAPTAATLGGSATGQTTASLSWSGATDAVSGVAGYEVYDADTSAQVTSTTADSASLTGLTPGTAYHFVVRTIDEAGRVSADSNTVTITTEAADTTAPTTLSSVEPSSADGANGWYVTAPVVSLISDEPGTTFYSIDGAEATIYSGSVTITQGVDRELAFRSIDTAGNAETTKTLTFDVDTTDPIAATLSGSASGTDGAELSWSGATDAVSGVASYRVYDVDSSELVASTTGTSATLSGLTPATTYHFVVRTVDEAGRLSSDSNTLSLTTDALDATPPTTLSSVEPSSADGANGWYVTAPVVSLLSDEPGMTYYALDAGASSVYSGPVIITEGQSKQIEFRSIDTAGNSEASRTLTFDVDVSAPTAATLSGSASGTDGAELSWSGATDAVSGVASYRVYNADTSELLTTASGTTASLTGLDDGTTYHFVVRTVDEAGNMSADSNTLSVTTEELDTTAPTTTRSVAPASADGANGWYVTAPVVTLSSNEPGTTYYAIDGGAASAYGAPVTMAQGTHTITYRSVDLASNSETTQSAMFKVDTSAPTAATLSGSATGQTTASLSWSGATDSVSGIAGYKVYNVDTSAQVASTTAGSASLTGLTSGTTYRFVVRTIDEAGRVSADSNMVTITTTVSDTTPPTTSRTVSPVTPNGSNGWYTTAPAVSLSANEAGTTYYAIDGGSVTTYSSPVTIAQGIHEFAYYSIDLASNRETTRTTTIKVDTSSPSEVTLSGSSTGTSTASLSWSGATDAVSGVATYRVYDADSGAQVTSTSGTSASLTGLTPGTTRRFYVRTVDQAGRLSGNSNTVTVTLDPAGNVTPGTAEVTADNVRFRFTSVTTTGSASANAYSPQRSAPTNFRFISGSYYDIHVTLGIFSGPVRVVVPYNPADVRGDPNELRLYHWTGTEWEDVTVEGSVDTDAHTIEGETTSFSDFAVSEPLASSSSTTPASSAWSLGLIGILAMGALALRFRREEGEA